MARAGRKKTWRSESKVQLGLERPLALVVIRTNQALLDPSSRLTWDDPKLVLKWSDAAERFNKSVRWSEDREPTPFQVLPMSSNSDVVIDPLRSFGEPVVS